MALRRRELDRAGGFAPLAAYLADDYRLGKAISELGLGISLSDCVVDTVLPRNSWRDAWRHRIRWARTLRQCRPWGYAGSLVTFAVPIAAAALALEPSLWPASCLCLALRIAAAWAVGARRLQDPLVRRYWPVLPIADLVSFAVWVASFFGRQVLWRGTRFRLEKTGELTPI